MSRTRSAMHDEIAEDSILRMTDRVSKSRIVCS